LSKSYASSQFFIADRKQNISNLKDKGFILAGGFRSLHPFLAGSTAFRPVTRQKPHRGSIRQRKSHLIAVRRQREEKR
jgi:hypothetical protein